MSEPDKPDKTLSITLEAFMVHPTESYAFATIFEGGKDEPTNINFKWKEADTIQSAFDLVAKHWPDNTAIVLTICKVTP